jgi:coenzyme F420-reducing hydrogenase gamma subunit
MKPKIAIFDFASCEGCQLQIANLEELVVDLVSHVEIVSFREVMKEHSDDYDVAFVEGSIQRPMDAERLREIRAKAKVLIALGDCAVTGCVNKLRNDLSVKDALTEVYGSAKPGEPKFFDLRKSHALDEEVEVDFYIRGCPVRKEQILYYIKRLSTLAPHKNMDARFGVPEKLKENDERSLVTYNPRKCILCRRCDAICREGLGVDALGVIGKGLEVQLGTPRNIGFDQNGCIHCGQCVSSCSVGALETKSSVAMLLNDLQTNPGSLSIALDPIVLSSLPERAVVLKNAPPYELEGQIISALKQAGFGPVVSYLPYLRASREADKQAGGRPQLLSWCKGAFNVLAANGYSIDRDEARSPWSLLLEDAKRKGETMCVATPCSALKGVSGFRHVLSALELDELFKQLEIEVAHCPVGAYDGESADSWGRHPGMVTDGETAVKAMRVHPLLKQSLETLRDERLELYPCLRRCLSGGGNYPTVDQTVIETRKAWLTRLWEAHA